MSDKESSTGIEMSEFECLQLISYRMSEIEECLRRSDGKLALDLIDTVPEVLEYLKAGIQDFVSRTSKDS